MAAVKDWFRRALDRTEAALEEAGRRVSLAWHILCGRLPRRVELRRWDKRYDRPSAMDVHSLETGNILLTILIWPDLEDDGSSASSASTVGQIVRAERIFRQLQKVAPALAANTTWEITHGLRWDSRREAWVRGDGEAAYEGPEVLTEEGPHAA